MLSFVEILAVLLLGVTDLLTYNPLIVSTLCVGDLFEEFDCYYYIIKLINFTNFSFLLKMY